MLPSLYLLPAIVMAFLELLLGQQITGTSSQYSNMGAAADPDAASSKIAEVNSTSKHSKDQEKGSKANITHRGRKKGVLQWSYNA